MYFLQNPIHVTPAGVTGCFIMPKGIPYKRYTPAFKKMVIETVPEEKLSYNKTSRRFKVCNHNPIQSWERIHLTKGALR